MSEHVGKSKDNCFLLCVGKIGRFRTFLLSIEGWVGWVVVVLTCALTGVRLIQTLSLLHPILGAIRPPTMLCSYTPDVSTMKAYRVQISLAVITMSTDEPDLMMVKCHSRHGKGHGVLSRLKQ